MGKATKAQENPYYIARMDAAACNDDFGSRESAAVVVGIERTRLARIELGVLTPYPDEIRMLADAYHAPGLLNYHCAHDCPIGQCVGIVPAEQANSLEQLAVQSYMALRSTETIRESLIEIADDGVITDDERPRLYAILSQLEEISRIAYQLKAIVRKIDLDEDA